MDEIARLEALAMGHEATKEYLHAAKDEIAKLKAMLTVAEADLAASQDNQLRLGAERDSWKEKYVRTILVVNTNANPAFEKEASK